jgi:CheY-like chemotaxis protein
VEDRRTVLYVEDEENDALFMRRAFAGAGLDLALKVVGSGRAAIEFLSGAKTEAGGARQAVPTVVLLDLNLPELPGFEVLKWMRAQPQLATTPVVIFSSSSKPEDRARARELGATDFWEKPNSGLRFGMVVERLKTLWISPLARQARS